MKPIENAGALTRRELLRRSLFGAGLLGLRSLATGLPVALLANPRRALAQGLPPCTPAAGSQFLILATMGSGDPVNTNVPGTYGFSDVQHSSDPSMAETSLSLAGTSTSAAAPWAALPQWALDRTCFFHHGTYTLIHADEPKVLGLMGNLAGSQNGQMFCSALSQQLATALCTVQPQPIALGQEAVDYQGQPLPLIPPKSLAAMLTTPSSSKSLASLAKLQALRDRDMATLNQIFKSEGNAAQRAFLDSYALSQTEARSLSQSLLSQLGAIPDNSPASQLAAAFVLIQMKVTPVVVVHLDFGGDNHSDPSFANETSQTVATLGTPGSPGILPQFLATLQGTQVPGGNSSYADLISLATMSVFGRTFTSAGNSGSPGRNHNPGHHCTVMIGKPFKGSIIGGIEHSNTSATVGQPNNHDYSAQYIDPVTGAGVPNGASGIPWSEGLQSAALTLGAGLGVDPKFLTENVTGGQIVGAALASG